MITKCPHGVPMSVLEEKAWFTEFVLWFDGKTGMICTGQEYDHERREYEPTACAGNPHGPVVFKWDLDQFLRGKRWEGKDA